MLAAVRPAVELFHLELLRNLRERPGRFEFALKGGTNLRFFFGSIRYSQDADMDALAGSVDDVQRAVTTALRATALKKTLAAHGIAIVNQSMAKQTETTQRWKLQLAVQISPSAGASRPPIPTTLEFSSREESNDYVGESRVEPVQTAVVQSHRVLAPLVRHYIAAPAIVQKIRALAERQERQARDVFDLEQLLFRTNPDTSLAGRVDTAKVRQAIERTMEITFEEYKTLVVDYLEDAYIEQYDDARQWEHIQFSVIDSLQGLLG
jgi:nucleotidyltransferase AbiEii toxin of type IV toxin-antitoxin system